MPWPRDEPDPLRAKRRQLAEQERELAERMSRLHQELIEGRESAKKPPEPPVWRLEDEPAVPGAAAESTSAKRRNLARQTQRDKIFFFIFMALLLVVMLIFFWIYQAHLRPA